MNNSEGRTGRQKNNKAAAPPNLVEPSRAGQVFFDTSHELLREKAQICTEDSLHPNRKRFCENRVFSSLSKWAQMSDLGEFH